MDAFPSMRLDRQVAVITGGGGGLGSLAARAFAAAGADVAVVGRTAASLQAAADAVRAAGRRAAALLRGGRPHLEAFERLSSASLVLNAQAADQAGIGLPLALIEQADEVIGD